MVQNLISRKLDFKQKYHYLKVSNMVDHEESLIYQDKKESITSYGRLHSQSYDLGFRRSILLHRIRP